LLDIDGTLPHPCRGYRWCDLVATQGLLPYEDAAVRGFGSTHADEPLLCSVVCDTRPSDRMVLRLYLRSFLTHLLADCALDTSKTAVLVSLYTRQSASYCAAVAQQVLTPALQQSGLAATTQCAPSPFYRLFHGGYCVQVESASMLYSAMELCDWSKTVSVSPIP
jgi:hypothetical protein